MGGNIEGSGTLMLSLDVFQLMRGLVETRVTVNDLVVDAAHLPRCRLQGRLQL